MEPSRIPNSLKRFRRIAGLSQKKAAITLRIQQGTLSRWEKGIAIPGLKYLFLLSLLYQALPTDLYGDVWQQLQRETVERQKQLLIQEEQAIASETYYL